MAGPTKIRATVQGDAGTLRFRLTHEMESGQRKDDKGNVIAAHFVQTLEVQLNGRSVISGQVGPAVSRNPMFLFRLKGVKAGDKVRVAWTDNRGEQRSDEETFGT
jgi:sulfur-oxidizing protein SoxZ